MDLVVSYFGSGIDGRNSSVTFLIEEESTETAKSRFVSAIKQAVSEHREKFCIWGRYHHVHNFVSTVSPKRFEYLEQVAKSRGRKAPEAVNPSAFDDEVTIIQMLPSVRTVSECKMAAKTKRRALRWMREGADYAYLHDELWDRDILLPATRKEGGMQVSPYEGTAIVLQPDWDYYIEGHQDEVVISAGPYELVVHEGEAGYMVKTAQ
jgi:hypothetical protein